MLDTGCRIQDAGYRMQNTGCRLMDRDKYLEIKNVRTA
jgi:hypothetical protein